MDAHRLDQAIERADTVVESLMDIHSDIRQYDEVARRDAVVAKQHAMFLLERLRELANAIHVSRNNTGA